MRAANDELLSYAAEDDPRVRRVVIRGIERLSGQRGLVEKYERARARSIRDASDPRPARFFREALRELDVTPQYPADALARIPREGPLVFVANHPFGVVDGLALCELALRTRGDVKIIIHRALFRDLDLQAFMLPIDFGGTRDAAKRNLEVRNQAIDYLRGGGTVAVFPGGGISTAQGGAFGPVTDLEWKLFPAKLIQLTRATVVPVYFPGQNSRLFQWVSQFSETLRLSLVVREVNNKRGHILDVRVGDPIPHAELAAVRDKRALTERLRQSVYALAPSPRSLAS
jgi:putative hemolysin